MAFPLILSLKKQKSYCGSKIKLLSPAKINLYLNIIGKYSGGFHRLESIVERISLSDELIIEVKKEPAIRIFSNCKSLETNKNLCFKAVQLLKKEFKISFGFDIFLKKNIPIGSGLGGGSSNAASTLLGVNSLLDLDLGRGRLYQLGAKLGSDVNFFLAETQFAFLQGRGEKVTPFNVGSKFHHFIIWPGMQIATKKIYKNTGVKLTKFFNNVKILKYALNKGDIFLIKKSIFNALEKEAFSVCGELRRLKACLNEQGIFSKVTGSGSAFYTIFSSRQEKVNKISIHRIKSIVPGACVVFDTHTF